LDYRCASFYISVGYLDTLFCACSIHDKDSVPFLDICIANFIIQSVACLFYITGFL
jgi:hypothetical protein